MLIISSLKCTHPAVMNDKCVCVCVYREDYLGGDEHGWIRQLVVVVHPEREEQNGSNAHDRHQGVEQRVEQLRLRRQRVRRGCSTQTHISYSKH